jgi:hypothetical protein
MHHETPAHIASALARSLPTGGMTYLDPAVGTGTLVKAAVGRIRERTSRIVCVDSNPDLLRAVKGRVPEDWHQALAILQGDFLSPIVQARLRAMFGAFDCVFMNPPFLGRKRDLRVVQLCDGGEATCQPHFVPAEAAFLLHAVDLVRDGGRVVSILPSSIVAGSGLRWLRELLFGAGNVTLVHELPRGSFPGVDAITYLVVFDKGIIGRETVLCNHRLWRPDRLRIRQNVLEADMRLDYRYHEAQHYYQRILRKWPDLRWQRLGTLASVMRGQICSSKCDESVVHSTSYGSGFWDMATNSGRGTLTASSVSCSSGDVLVRRVGRNSALTFGTVVLVRPRVISDCVFRIRPTVPLSWRRLLFGLRVVYACAYGQSLLERGCGASYLTKEDMLRLEVPGRLSTLFNKAYQRYCRALSRRDFESMLEIEEEIRSTLMSSAGG